ncbi:olfactory receptor 14L1-like [Macrochelys suwanniensis]
MSNQTTVTEFLLLGFSDVRELQILHFVVFLIIYLAGLMGNLLIITAITLDHHLHTPMYFFLVNLSILDLGSISVTIPKSMANSLMNSRSISYSGCVTQIFLFVFFISADFALLTVMAYDRHIAICQPLHYERVMNRTACVQMAASAWISGILYSALHTGSTFVISFCGGNRVDQFFCEIPQLLKLACSDSDISETGFIVFGACLVLSCFVFIIVSYVQIFKAVLSIPSEQGRRKAFSTCIPHLTVVSLLICTGTVAYLKPTSGSATGLDLMMGVLYSVVPSVMNPIIYSMRNREVKGSLSKLIGCRLFSKNKMSIASHNVLRKKMSNQTTVTEFLLLGFSDVKELQILYFMVFLMSYLAALMGNLLIITAVALDHHLHTPMYFFLVNLSILDLGYISVTIPKSMANFLMNTRSISYSGCITQVFLFLFFISADFALLTVMAYDRYVAICRPLHYEGVMNRIACVQMAAGAWISGILYSALHTASTFVISFCGGNRVDQFFCEIPQLLKLACSDSDIIETGALVFSACLVLSCFVFIIVSYVQIFKAVLRIPSEQGRRKAFSTCIPHLTVVSLFIFTGIVAYLKPSSSSASGLDLMMGVLYSVVPPMMNPIIYTMRNREVKGSLSKLIGWRSFSKNKMSILLH